MGSEMCIRDSTFSRAKQRREEGTWAIPMSLSVDAMSVFAAVTASQIKIPAEKALWSHVQYLRELLDIRVLLWLIWIDTRDMHADGLTKGSVERTALQAIMNGEYMTEHEYKAWQPRLARRPVDVGTKIDSVDTNDVDDLADAMSKMKVSDGDVPKSRL